MFFKSVDEIHGEMLSSIDKSYQKSVGFPTFDITKAFAIVLAPVYILIEKVAAKFDVRNIKGDELTLYTQQRKNVIRKEATKATGVLMVYGNGVVKRGDMFETEAGTQFIAIKTVEVSEVAEVPIEAVIPGSSGNVGAESIIKIPKTLQGINECINTSETMGGYAAETDESLLERYLEAVRRPPTSGNKYHYKSWAKEVPGVGDAKVFPLWAGDNTVKVVIINDNKQPADSLLVAKVQQYIDPNKSGTGDGEAPIGAYCTVESATELKINVTAKVKLLSGYTLEETTKAIETGIIEYLKAVAFNQNYISYGKIANAINDAVGVEDYSELFVNNSTANIFVKETGVAVKGMVNISEQ